MKAESTALKSSGFASEEVKDEIIRQNKRPIQVNSYQSKKTK